LFEINRIVKPLREAFAVFGKPSRKIHGLHRRFRQTRIGFCAAPTLAIVMHSKDSSQPSMRYFVASSLLFSSTAIQGAEYRCIAAKLFFETI
jgi:hypothetical protein